MRLPNSYGTVYKDRSRPLRKPWKVIVTTGWKIKDEKAVPIRKCIGYFATKTEGLEALTLYHNNGLPEDITFKNALDKYFEENQDGWSLNTSTTYNLMKKKMEPLWERKIRSIKTADLERILDKAAPSARTQLKTLMHGAYSWAMRHDYCDKDYSKLVRSYASQQPKEKTPFSDEEIATLWKDGSDIACSVLVAIYSGWRWNELMNFEIVDDDCMLGGSKTEAGKGRIVPIHSKIKPILDKMYKTASYGYFRVKFVNLMQKYGMNHTFHETRHTTATKLYGQDEHLVKLILGHTEGDLTKRVYTHNTIEQLRAVIESIDVGSNVGSTVGNQVE